MVGSAHEVIKKNEKHTFFGTVDIISITVVCYHGHGIMVCVLI